MENNEFVVYIGGFSLLFLILLLVFKGRDGTPTQSYRKTVIIESMTDANLEQQKMSELLNANARRELQKMNMNNPEDSFCQVYKGKSNELEGRCNTLSSSNCNLTNCCVYLNLKDGTGKCVAGNIHGPTYKTDSNGNLITMDSYYYRNKIDIKI